MNESARQDLVEALFELGFSQYEAKCYVGLMNQEPQTGYRVAKATGVPQPKVYETLRRLVTRGVVHEIAGDPTRFSAIPPAELLGRLKSTFDLRLTEAERTVDAMVDARAPRPLEYVESFDARDDLMSAARDCVGAASRRVYLSASAPEIEELEPDLRAAVARGVDLVILAFGRRVVDVPGANVFRHASTDGALYRHHQARHIALVSDSLVAINAIAVDGEDWHGVRTPSKPIIAAVKGYIRHDIDMQQVFADFGPELLEAYGAGLQTLGAYRLDHPHAVWDEAEALPAGAESA